MLRSEAFISQGARVLWSTLFMFLSDETRRRDASDCCRIMSGKPIEFDPALDVSTSAVLERLLALTARSTFVVSFANIAFRSISDSTELDPDLLVLASAVLGCLLALTLRSVFVVRSVNVVFRSISDVTENSEVMVLVRRTVSRVTITTKALAETWTTTPLRQFFRGS